MKKLHMSPTCSRRDFIKAGSMTAAAVALGGCAKNPVTGESQFMLVSEEQEIQMDRQSSPHQLSADYGVSQDGELNEYLAGIGDRLAATSHRPHMPYSFQVVNANYINAYAFPGGTIACTRAIMLEMDNEAELSALLGHEIAHVNARHTASRMSTQMIAGAVVGIGGAVVGAQYGNEWGALAGGLGGFGLGALLASYSRSDERQADDLGMEYMTNAQYNPDGMVGLMDMLNEQHDRQPSALEVMFSTHPMSSERLATARQDANSKYLSAREYSMYRESYMDNTASLRRIAPTVEKLQDGEKLLRQKRYNEAEDAIGAALKATPDDYPGLLLMSKCLVVQERYEDALPYAAQAHEAYPSEPQALQLSGLLQVKSERYAAAFQSFDSYEKALPGNPLTVFFKGYSLEGMGNRHEAANEYLRFLRQVNQGNQAKYAHARLVQWGYLRGEAAPVANPLEGLA